MLHLYEQKSESRDELVRETRRVMLELSQQMRESVCEHPEAERMMLDLAQQLGDVKGKKSYGYLPKALKKQVDEIVDQMERLPVVNECYQKWWDLQCKVNDFYSEKERQRPSLSQQKEFRAIKNAVIQKAKHIRQNQIFFEDRDMEDGGGWVDDRELTWACWELRGTIENEELPLAERDAATAKMKQLAKAGDAHAQYFLGLLYQNGSLLIPDTEKARHWLEQAAKQEIHAAQYSLGRLLLSDNPNVRDQTRASR